MSPFEASASEVDATGQAPSRNDRLLLDFLEFNDAPCPVCGYNVRQLTSPICPECRHRLQLTVGASDVTLRWFLASIVPGMFSGIAAIFLMIPLTVAPFAGGGAAPGLFYAIDAFGYASGIAALVMMARRKRIIALPRGTQLALAATVWTIHVFALFAFIGIAWGWY